MNDTITVQEYRKLKQKNDWPFDLCPCCRRHVDKCHARSIFDFNVKICKRCALHEKMNSKFNWIIENNFYGNV